MTRNAKDQQKHAEPKQLNSDKERVKDSSLPDLDLNLDDDEALLAALEDALQADVGQAASATSSTKDANAASKTESTEHAQSTPAAAQTAQRATALQAESSAAQAEVEKRSVGAAAELAADLAAESVAESVAESATVTTASDNAHLETKGITSDVTSVNQMAADASAVTSEQAAAPQDASHAGAAAAAAAAETVVADAGDAAVDADAAASVAADAADAAASAAAVAANETTDGAALEKIDAQDQDNPLNVFISPQGVLGVGRANALHTKPAAGAHLDKGFGRTNIDADFLQANSNVELPNGHKFHLRQLMPEIAKLSTAQEQKLEHDFNAGFAHYANEMLITRSLEELGTKPYEALSADYLRQIIQELAPDLSPNYIMKFASLLAKVSNNSETLPAQEAFKWATANGAKAFGLNAGVIEKSALADAVLLDLSNERLTPNYNLVSNWVYAADSRAISGVLCDGRFVMHKGIVENEEEILAKARESVARLAG